MATPLKEESGQLERPNFFTVTRTDEILRLGAERRKGEAKDVQSVHKEKVYSKRPIRASDVLNIKTLAALDKEVHQHRLAAPDATPEVKPLDLGPHRLAE